MRYPDDYDIVFTGHDTSLSGYQGASSLLCAVEAPPIETVIVVTPKPKTRRQHQVRHKAVDKVSRGLAPNTGAR